MAAARRCDPHGIPAPADPAESGRPAYSSARHTVIWCAGPARRPWQPYPAEVAHARDAVPESVPALVTLYVWSVPLSRAGAALRRTAVDRTAVRHYPGARFSKALGTGHGRTFTPRDADPRRWALLTTWSDESAAAGFDEDPAAAPARWRSIAEEQWRIDLRPLSAHGRWSGREPFGTPIPRRSEGAAAALTRGRIALGFHRRFRRSTPPVAAAVQQADGLLFALGIGEAPLGLQGTFSLWESHRALRAFAYRDPEHQAVMERTHRTGWYAEDLFARFAVVSSQGTVDGQDPLQSGSRGEPGRLSGGNRV